MPRNERIASRRNYDQAEAITLIERAMTEHLMGADSRASVRQQLFAEMSSWLVRAKPNSTFCSICRSMHGKERVHASE